MARCTAAVQHVTHGTPSSFNIHAAVSGETAEGFPSSATAAAPVPERVQPRKPPPSE